MVNVLPSGALKKARRFYRARAVFVGALTMIACGGIIVLALLPTYLLVNANAEAENEHAVAIASQDMDREEISRTQVLLRELRDVATSTPSILDHIGVVLAARPPGVRVYSIHFDQHGKDGAQFVVSGAAASREAIPAYRSALSKEPRFTDVSLPIENLFGTDNNTFTITLTGDL